MKLRLVPSLLVLMLLHCSSETTLATPGASGSDAAPDGKGGQVPGLPDAAADGPASDSSASPDGASADRDGSHAGPDGASVPPRDAAADSATDAGHPLDGGGASLWSQIDPAVCNDVKFVSDSGAEAHPDAASYFLGEFSKEADGSWKGREYWLLYATPDWVKNGGKDCRVVWNVTAIEGAPQSCGSCEKGLTVTATLDTVDTNCDEGLYKGSEAFSVKYDVDIAPDGTSKFTFAKSGKLLGTGYGADDRLGYVSARTCMYF